MFPLHLRFRTRLLVTYLLLALIPLVTLGIVFYQTGISMLEDLSGKQALETLKKTNEITDYKFKKIHDESLSLMSDKSLFLLMSSVDKQRESTLVAADRGITALLQQRFAKYEDILSVNLYTSYYTFGPGDLPGSPSRSALESVAVDHGGRMKWVPTYDMAEMYNDPSLLHIDRHDRLLYSVVMQVNNNYVENGIAYFLPPGNEKPVLILSFRETYFQDLLERSIPLDGTVYFVVNEQGRVVSATDTERVTSRLSDAWVRQAISDRSGMAKTMVENKEVVMVFDTSPVTGWTTVALIPTGELVKDIAPAIFNSVLSIALILLAVSVLLAILLSGQIARPIKTLIKAIKQVGIGNFNAKIKLDNDREFGVLFNRFNEMNNKIQTLITENYESKLREKEAEIMMLNVQLNPHFLYNTLNIMNWVAIENDQKQLSKMLVSLSNMLYYTTQNNRETGELQEEIGWLQNYLYIMSERFEGKFTVDISITDDLYGTQVPRLFLHPIVENAIIHGFGSIRSGGEIRIVGRKVDGRREFTVTDNGRGMDERLLSQLMHPESGHNGFKNVHTRIRLLHGEAYGLSVKSTLGKGTEVIVTLPDHV